MSDVDHGVVAGGARVVCPRVVCRVGDFDEAVVEGLGEVFGLADVDGVEVTCGGGIERVVESCGKVSACAPGEPGVEFFDGA